MRDFEGCFLCEGSHAFCVEADVEGGGNNKASAQT